MSDQINPKPPAEPAGPVRSSELLASVIDQLSFMAECAKVSRPADVKWSALDWHNSGANFAFRIAKRLIEDVKAELANSDYPTEKR